MGVVLGAHLGAQAETGRARPSERTQRRERANEARDVTIPFRIGPANCVDRDRLYAVTIRIYNVLAQPVSVPVLAPRPGSDATQPALDGRPIVDLRLPCGWYGARWNGLHAQTGRRLAPGVYVTELVIDGQRVTRKITLGA